MALTSRIYLKKTLSPPAVLSCCVNVLVFHLVYVISQQTVEAYVTYFYDDPSSSTRSYRFPSTPSNIGNSFQDNSYVANLFTAPLSNRFMCKSKDITRSLSHYQPNPYRHTRRSLISAMNDVSTSHLRSIKPSPKDQKRFMNENSNSKFKRGLQSRKSLALAVEQGGGCSVEEKARNVMELNEIYSSPGGPKIEFLVVLDSNMNSVDDDEYYDDTGTPIDLWISYMEDYGSDLLHLMQEIYKLESRIHHIDRSVYLTESSFFVEGGNEWQFQVILDGINITDDRRLLWVSTGFLFFGIIPITIMICNFVILLIIYRGLRWTRNEAGRINGITWNRPPQGLRPGFMAAMRDLTSRRMTDLESVRMSDEQIKELPVIEYNVSDMKDICCKYNSGEDGNNDDAENAKFDSFKGNAYESITSCPICMEDFEHGEKLLLLPKCGHFYHTKCIAPWLKDKSTCAYCQTTVSVPMSAVQQLNIDEEGLAAVRNGNGSSSQVLTAISGNNNLTSMETLLAPVSNTVTVGDAANNEHEMVESIVESDNDNTPNYTESSSNANEGSYVGNETVNTQEDATGRDSAAVSPNP